MVFASDPSSKRMDDITKGVTIGVIDSGVNYNHEDLFPRIILGQDQCGSKNNRGQCIPDSDPKDEYGHGTLVAGVAAASTNNGVGISGAAFTATVIAEKVMFKSELPLWTNVAKGIKDAVNRGAKVINVSIGGEDSDLQLGIAVSYALTRNRVVVASAGNENEGDRRYPAAYNGVIAVGASDENDERAKWSTNLGGPCSSLTETNSASNYGSWVDLYAPGSNILTPSWDVDRGRDAYRTACAGGTSSAAPLVSGVASLMLFVNPRLIPSQVEAIIKYSARETGNFDQGNRGNKIYLLDAEYAVERARSAIGSFLVHIDYPFSRLPDRFPSDIPLEESGNAVTQNFVSATDIGQFQQTRGFITTRGLDDASAIYRSYFASHGYEILIDSVSPNSRFITARKDDVIFTIRIGENPTTHVRAIVIDLTILS